MRRWRRSGLVLVCLLLLPTSASAETCTMMTREERLTVPADSSCVPWETCQQLEGISLASYNITAKMDNAKERLAGEEWEVRAEFKGIGHTYRFTTLLLCQYDADHALITCEQAYWKGARDGIQTTIKRPADHLRVILTEGPTAQSYLRLVARTK